LEDLLKTVEGAGCNFCVGCFNGEYPVDIEKAKKETEGMDLSADE
jgi:amidophosphoribosyltransferase